MLRLALLVPFCLAACTDAPPTYSISGSLDLQAGPAPTEAPPSIFDNTIDTLDTVAYSLTDNVTGVQVKTGQLAEGSFDITGVPPGEYTLDLQAQHHELLSNDIELLGEAEFTDVSVQGPTDLGFVALPYAPVY
jgi:hypothetical protein